MLPRTPARQTLKHDLDAHKRVVVEAKICVTQGPTLAQINREHYPDLLLVPNKHTLPHFADVHPLLQYHLSGPFGTGESQLLTADATLLNS